NSLFPPGLSCGARYPVVLQCIVLPAFRANGLSIGEGKLVAVLAHPSRAPCGVAHHQGKIRDLLGHYRTCRDEGVAPDIVAADNGGIGTDGSALLHPG